MKRHATRLRSMQRRYHRKGRRRAPLGRPPDKGKPQNFIKRPTRTYNFNTIPSTGKPATRWEYTIFVFRRLQSVFTRLNLHELHNYRYLQQQRHLYYGKIGIRYKNILPKHKHLLDPPTTEAQQLSDQIQEQLSEGIIPLHYDESSLPPDPSIWSKYQPIQRITLPLSCNPPLLPLLLHHHSIIRHALLLVTTRTFREILPNLISRHQHSTNSTTCRLKRHSLFLVGLILFFLFEGFSVSSSCYGSHSTPPVLPAHHNITTFHDHNFNLKSNRELDTFELNYTASNDEALSRWNHIYLGKQTHSL